MNIDCDMGENVTGIGYQFYGRAGMLGTRVTTGITNPTTGIYAATATPPNGTVGIKWDDVTGLKYATAPIAPVVSTESATPFETARQLIYDRFTANWNHAIFPVTFEGMAHTEPESGTWGRFSIAFGSSEEPTVGRSFSRTQGIIYLSVFVKKENGIRPFTQATDLIRQIFARALMRQDGVEVRMSTPSLADAGARPGYRQKNVACNFVLDAYDTP